MTDKHKKVLMHFITVASVYIRVSDENDAANKSSIAAFIRGYEIGTGSKCKFSQLLSKHFEENLSIKYLATGWPGQVTQYSEKKAISWIRSFRQAGLETIAGNGGLDDECKQILKKTITILIERIRDKGDIYFNERWVEEWNSFCLVKSPWFKNMWTAAEYKVIASLDKEVKNNNVFKVSNLFLPTSTLLKLSKTF